MYQKNKTKKRLAVVLALCLVLSLAAALQSASFAVEQSDCTLRESMEYLVLECGQRFRGTPNEDKAAEYVYNKFKEFGYTDVQWAKPVMSGTITAISRIVLTEGPDILGNATPNTDAFGTGGRFTGALVDFGTFASGYVAPTGLTGNVVGAIRFTGAPTGANINSIVTAFNAANPGANLTGLMTTRSDTANTHTAPGAGLTGITSDIHVLGTAFTNFNRALQDATYTGFNKVLENPGNFVVSADRRQYNATNVALAKKPAPGNNPDLVIVVTGHLDSVLLSPGANDNASSCATVIELAKRFKDVDLGNIEIWFAVLGSEEGNSMRGAVYVAEQVIAEGKRDIAINMNMDMIASSPTAMTAGNWGSAIVPGNLLNAVSMDINVNAATLTLNLPSYLVTNFANDIDWAAGIDNVRIYNYGGSDHTQFHNRGIEAASMIIVRNSDDSIENGAHGYHSGADNLAQNYSYERHIMCTNLMANGIWKAIEQEVSKRAKFYIYDNKDGSKVVLLDNAEQLFNTFNTVTATFRGIGSGQAHSATFSADNPVFLLPDSDTYSISNVVAQGAGIADNLDAVRNARLQNMRVNLVSLIEVKSLRILAPSMVTVARGQKGLSLEILVNEGASSAVAWSTSNPAFATVDESGLVTVKNLTGSVVLTATASNGISHSIILRIT